MFVRHDFMEFFVEGKGAVIAGFGFTVFHFRQKEKGARSKYNQSFTDTYVFANKEQLRAVRW